MITTYYASLLRAVGRPAALEAFEAAAVSEPVLSGFGSPADVLKFLKRSDAATIERRAAIVGALARLYSVERGAVWSTTLTAAFSPLIRRLSTWVEKVLRLPPAAGVALVVEEVLEAALTVPDDHPVRYIASRTSNRVRESIGRERSAPDQPCEFPLDDSTIASPAPSPREALQRARFEEAVKRAVPIVIEIAAQGPSNDVMPLLDTLSEPGSLSGWVGGDAPSTSTDECGRLYQRTKRQRARITERVRDEAERRGIRFEEIEAGPRFAPVANWELN